MHIIYTPGTMLYDIEIQGTEEELRLVHAALVEARKTISLGIGSGRPDPQSNPVIRTYMELAELARHHCHELDSAMSSISAG